MTKHILILLAAISLVGCGHTTTHRVVTGAIASAYNGPVRILMEGEPPPENFREVALVQANGHGTHADMPHVIEGLRHEAAMLGCDTLYRVHIDQGATHASATAVCGVTR